MKFKIGDEIKSEVAVARVTDQHYQNDKNGTAFMVKTEFRVTDVATNFQQKSVLHTYFTKAFFMIQGKGKMHDNTFCKDYFHENILKGFIKEIMDTKGQEIMFMNKMLQDIKKDVQKRKLPEKKERCDICGRMFMNSTGVNIHKKRMHMVETKKVVQGSVLTRSNSVVSIRSEQSVRSPPPKKSQHEVKPKEVLPDKLQEVKPEEVQEEVHEVQEVRAEEVPLPGEEEPIEVDNHDVQFIQPKETSKTEIGESEPNAAINEDDRMSKEEGEELKGQIELLRRINKNQLANHNWIVQENNKKFNEYMRKVQEEHAKEVQEKTPMYNILQEEYKKALTQISKIQNKNDLLKAREEVLQSFANLEVTKDGGDDQVDECIIEGKCEENCRHIVEEDLRNLKNMRKMKNQGGRRNTPQEPPEVREKNRCPQCNFISEHKTALEQHMKEVHTKYPSCPFCFIGFTNHQVLRNHIDQMHEDKTLKRVQGSSTEINRTNSAVITDNTVCSANSNGILHSRIVSHPPFDRSTSESTTKSRIL